MKESERALHEGGDTPAPTGPEEATSEGVEAPPSADARDADDPGAASENKDPGANAAPVRGRHRRPGRLERQIMRLSEENARLKRLAGLDGDGPEADRRNRAAPDGASDGPLAPGASPASPAGVRDRFASFKARCADARGRHPDFDAAVFDPQAPIAPVLAEALLEADDGPELAYFLAKNPADAVRLGRLSPPQAAIELGRIVARWGRPPARKTTNAPAPVSTLGGASASADKDPGRMPMAEYRRWRGFS